MPFRWNLVRVQPGRVCNKIPANDSFFNLMTLITDNRLLLIGLGQLLLDGGDPGGVLRGELAGTLEFK